MEKASIKHLDFQLQREKARSKDLEVECKALHAQIAQLEQDKAGLRREKLVLTEEAKKIAKLDDRIHLLQKDIESRDAIIASERAAAEQARAETEEIRSNANASIAQWIDAERQWTAEQAALNDAAIQFRSRIEELEAALQTARNDCADAKRVLEAERERTRKLSDARDTLEAEVRNFHVQAEKLQNKVCDLEQTIYKLDVAGDKQQETIALKETEIRTLETALENERKTVERMEQTVTSLNDRVNAVKMMSLDERGENEKLQCDLLDANKEIARLTLHVESLKRDASFAEQSQAGLQKALDEMRERCRLQQDDLKEKIVEIRRHELTISQLNVELKKSENQGGEWSFRNSSLEAELQRTKDALKSSTSAAEVLLSEKDELTVKLHQLQSIVEAKDEEMVLLQNQFDEKLEVLTKDILNLEKEVAARQSVINDLTEQLNSTSEKNATYHTKILHESAAAGKVRQELTHMLSHVHAQERELQWCKCVADKADAFTLWLSEWSAISLSQANVLFALLQKSQGEAAGLKQHVNFLTEKAGDSERACLEKSNEVRENERRIVELQEQLDDQTNEALQLKEAIERNEMRLGALQAELSAALQQVDCFSTELALSKEQLMRKEAAMSEKDVLRTELQASALAKLNVASGLQLRGLEFCEEQTKLLQDLCSARVEIVIDFFSTVVASVNEEKAQALLAKEQAELTCRELTAFAKEAKMAMSKCDRAVAEKQESLSSRIALLEGQGALLRREKEQYTMQLSVLLRRFEDEQRAHEDFKKESQSALEAVRAKNASAERDVAKLRSAINYEVARKCEYKAALEGAKKLLGESEEMRAADAARALEAIKKANDESNYWVRCFDRLKRMVEQSRKSGKRLPSIDADTLLRLEEAKTTMSPIQTQDVNLAATGVPKMKRLREDTAGPSK
jgi:chromosome segregation ATPase